MFTVSIACGESFSVSVQGRHDCQAFQRRIAVRHSHLMLIIVLLTSACARTAEIGQGKVESVAGNFASSLSRQKVLSGEVKVANAAWWGYNPDDSTLAIQGAIDSGASKVIVPYVGSDWIVRPLTLVSNQEIIFEPGVVVVAKKGSFKGKLDCLFFGFDLSNVTLRGYGATFRMHKKDYQSRGYMKSEWRHVILLRGSRNISILGLRLESSGGDGITIGSTKDKRMLPCRNILIRDCVCHDNHRQGISVGSVEKLRIENCLFSNTMGTEPQSGIDMEPDRADEMLVDVVVEGCMSEGNAGAGFMVDISRLGAKSRDVSVLFVNCYIRKCTARGLTVRETGDSCPTGWIEFRNCTVEDIKLGGLYAILKPASRVNVRFDNCKWMNASTNRNRRPIHLALTKKQHVGDTAYVHFKNCYVFDERNRPFMKITDSGKSDGIYDVRGEINVFNRYGAKMNAGGSKTNLTVRSVRRSVKN